MTTRFIHKSVELDYDLSAKSTKIGRLYQVPGGNYYPSMTTVLGWFTKDSIHAWRAAVGAEEANRVARHACARGNAVHYTAERYLNNEDNYLKEGTMPHVIQMWNSMKKVLDERVNNIAMQECPLYSDELMMAGRVDLIADFDGKPSIIDFKTSSRRKSEADITGYFLQATGYSLMFEERTGKKIDQLVIIMVVEGSDESLIFIESRDKWVDLLRERRDQYFEHLETVKYQ
jgi:genome maintenance exonuclease 1